VVYATKPIRRIWRFCKNEAKASKTPLSVGEKTNPMTGVRALRSDPSAARRHTAHGATPRGTVLKFENTNPMTGEMRRNAKHAIGAAGRVAILSFQTTVGRRFEHLAAKRDRRVPRRRRLESRLAAKNGRPT
jgi:hypothetical protein